jgi:GntR family transcriptional regulator
MFVTAGARAGLLLGERSIFLEREWPRVLTRIEQLGLDVGQLLGARQAKKG